MKFFGKIEQILRKPFPLEEGKSDFIRTIAIISIFVAFFLYIFQPFGIYSLESNKLLFCLGFGGVAFVASIIYEFVMNGLFKFKSKQENFTFGIWILYVLGLILTISFANFLFARITIFGFIQWEWLPDMIYGTFAIGIFPTVVLGAIALVQMEKKYQIIANEINQQKSKTAVISKTIDLPDFNIPVGQIRYVEALQNYVKIGYINSEGRLTEQTERATLKNILDGIEGSSIVRCHRSFLVNREAIVSTSGNAQGLLLSLLDCNKIIPVSRSYVTVFRNN